MARPQGTSRREGACGWSRGKRAGHLVMGKHGSKEGATLRGRRRRDCEKREQEVKGSPKSSGTGAESSLQENRALSARRPMGAGDERAPITLDNRSSWYQKKRKKGNIHVRYRYGCVRRTQILGRNYFLASG